MRWSFLHCLFVALLTSVVFDGVVARPIPNDLYRRTPTGGSPSPPHTPAPHTPGKQPQSPSHQTPSKIPVAVKSHGSSNLSPSHQTPSKLPVAVKSHNLRPRPPKAPLTVAQGKKAAPPPSKIPRPVTNKKDTAAGLKAWNYRDKAIRQGKIYDPKKQQVVQGKPTAKQLGHCIRTGNLLFCSGCIPLDPSSMQIVSGGIEAQTEQALKNLKAVVEAGGSELGKVVKTTIFLKSMNDFATVNEIYAKFFGNHAPARSAVEVARLPKDALVEIECVAS